MCTLKIYTGMWLIHPSCCIVIYIVHRRIVACVICVHKCGMLMFASSLRLYPSPPSTSYLYPDASLTVSNIYQATSTVDYGRLNDCLDVPNSVYYQIDTNPSYPTEEKKREAIITYFLNTIPLASWATLAGKLYYWEEHVSLEAVRKYLHHTTG